MDRDDLEAEQLGELPIGVARERRETYDDRRDAPLYGEPGAQVDMPAPRDVQQQNRAFERATDAPAAEVYVDYVVQSTFDARPINGVDFQHQAFFGLDIGGDPPGNPNPVDVTFQVPAGRIGIIREFRWFADTILATTFPGQPSFPEDFDDFLRQSSPFRLGLLINGQVVRTYDQIFQQSGRRTCYAIAGESQSITLRFQANTDFVGTGPNPLASYFPSISVVMRGNLLQSRGREQIFEPANRYIGDRLK